MLSFRSNDLKGAVGKSVCDTAVLFWGLAVGASSYVPWLPGDMPLACPIFRQPRFLTWLSSFTLEDMEAQRDSVTWPTSRVTVCCGQPTTVQWTPVAPITLIHTLTSTSWDRTFCGHPVTVRSQEGREPGLEPGTWGFKSPEILYDGCGHQRAPFLQNYGLLA